MAKRSILALLLLFSLMSCAQQHWRGTPYESKELSQLLAFLGERGASRADVEARLGVPASTFEDGQVAAYELFEEAATWVNDPRSQRPVPVTYTTNCTAAFIVCRERTIQIMVEYDPQGGIVRVNVLKPFRQG